MDGDKVVASYKSAEEKFEVKGETIAVTGVRIRPSTVSIEPGETYQLTATVMPENASNKAVEWKSNHPELVSVDENGLITAIKRQAGTTVYITAKTVDGGKSSTCQVTVKEPSGGEVAVTGISLNQTSAELEVGKTLQLKPTITPSNATNKSVQWTSSNSAVASVDINGLVTAKAIGTAQITAKTEDGGKTATVSITVKKASEQNVPVTGVSINMSSLSLKVGESATLTTTIAPANATNKGVTWTTSMSSVATVTSDGVVTAKAAGTAVITAKTKDGGKTATCNVTVTYTPDPGGEVSVTQVTISPTSVNMTVGDTKQFSVKIDPANATNQEVSWSSSDPSVASIDSKGLVTAKAEGKATITVTANDGGVSSKATVTVNNKTVPVTGVSVSPASLSMEIGGSKALSVTVSPSDATDKTYTVTSDNTSVAEVSNGNVIAKGAGTANITVTTTDGSFQATCKVTVNKPQMTISADPSSLAFGDVNVDECSTKTFSISNTGKAEVKVSGISVPEAYSVDVTSPFTIAVGQSKTVTVTFTPTDGKDYNGSITITSDADNQPTVTVSGKGIKSSTPSGSSEAVDLGLPSGLLWASCNLGASKPEEYGDYFAWGETEPYYETGYAQSESSVWKKGKEAGYNWASYKWCKGSESSLTKYSITSPQGESFGYNGFVDGKTELDPQDDAAHVHLGGKWRMPTDAEWTELRENCTWTWGTLNGVKGRLVTGKNGNKIFLPASGNRYDAVFYNIDSWGYYWSSTVDDIYSELAWEVDFSSNKLNRIYSSRYYGHSIRPVMDK
ncbi:MAG: Ig-like domain-containing protein [Bacteroidales bacterium]|nr:Ig-like domain-containing protein [Bacteroidales bacterium]